MESKVKTSKIVFYLLAALLLVGTLVYTLLTGQVGVSLFTGSDRYYGDKYFDSGDAVFEERITVLDIGWVTGSVNVRILDSDEWMVRVTETAGDELKKKESMTHTLKDGTLTLRFAEKKAIFLSNYRKEKSLTVEITRVMAEYLDEIRIRTVNASVSVGSFQGAFLDVETGTGDVTLSSVQVKQVHFASSKGKLTMENCLTDRLHATSKQGNIFLTGLAGMVDEKTDTCFLSTGSGAVSVSDSRLDRLHIDTRSGATTLTGVNVAGECQVTSVSGGIRGADLSADGLDLETDSGSVYWQTAAPARQAKIETGSGSVELVFSPEASFVLTFDTSTGKSNCTFPHLSVIDGKMVAGNGVNLVDVETVSGGLILRAGS